MVGAKPEQAIVYGNSSLNIMYDQVSRAFIFGLCGNTPWCKLDKVKFLCPVPGYDRHFAITEEFGVEMINIPMTEDGPDMDMVEKYVNNDASVKGIWCVPKYSNPQGVVYSDETVERLQSLSLQQMILESSGTMHTQFIISMMISRQRFQISLSSARKRENPDMVFEFCSTSKVTFPGVGVAGICTSEKTVRISRSALLYRQSDTTRLISFVMRDSLRM